MPPQKTQMGRMVRQAAFPDMDSATKFADDVMRAAHSYAAQDKGTAPFPVHLFESMMSRNGGSFFYSSRRKETLAYDYQLIVHDSDLSYLFDRDPTADLIVSSPAIDAWWKLPRTFDSRIDDYLRFIRNRGFNQKAEGADMFNRRDGAAFIYINASGKIDESLKSGDKIHGFDWLTVTEDVMSESVVKDNSGDPLLKQHGVHSLEISVDGGAGVGKPITIHGSRLVLFREDNTAKALRGKSALRPMFDDLWNLRDVVFAQKEGQYQGNPIVVSVDLENKFSAGKQTALDINTEVKEMKQGFRQAFSPVEGLLIERLGPVELEDPTPIIRTLCSRISNGTRGLIPVNRILASSRGSEQVTSEDRADEDSGVMKRNERFALPILSHMLEVGKVIGEVPRRAEMPFDIEWPELRIQAPRDRAYVGVTEAMMLVRTSQAGYLPEERIMRHFQKRQGGVLPLQPKNEADVEAEQELEKIRKEGGEQE